MTLRSACSKGCGRHFPDLPADLGLRRHLDRSDVRGLVVQRRTKSSSSSTSSSNGSMRSARKRAPSWSLALRQCDGERLQALLMVRDDFWMALTRFMGEHGDRH